MEDMNNIVLTCKDCAEKMYPDKGKYNVNVGDFAKLKFTDGDRAEYMWVEVIKVDRNGNKYEGRLDNDPVLVLNVKYNEKIMFKKEDILDVS